MPITSASTLPQIEAEYLDTASWHETNDLGLMRRFRTAVMALLLKKPTRSQLATMSMQFDTRLLSEQLEEIKAAIESHPDSTGPAMTTRADLREFR